MFFPIRTDRRLQRTPWVNYALIAANVIAFMVTSNWPDAQLRRWMLTPSLPQPWQFLTYQFLHQGFMHLGSNMLFLYVFGNSVEDRIGRLPYLLFYLAGGTLAGLGHAVLADSPVLGASGAVCAVTGAYLALFPLSNITIVYWFIFAGAFEVSSFVLICFQIVQDVAMYAYRSGGVAYLAHLSGYTFGFAVGVGLLLTRMVLREPYDLMALIAHWRRRRQFQALARSGYTPWDTMRPGDPPPRGAEPTLSPRQQQVMQLRARIASTPDLPSAAALYEQLLDLDPAQTLAPGLQMDVANQLMSMGRHDAAARAYELLLNNHASVPHREQVQLILGVVYMRYLNRRQRARELLTAALPDLGDPHQRELAQSMLAQLDG